VNRESTLAVTFFLFLSLTADPGAGPTDPAAGECALPPELEGVYGHVLFELRNESAIGTLEPRVLYASARPEEKKEEFVAALAHCVRKGPPREGDVAGVQEGEARFVSLHYFEPAPRGTPRVSRPDGALFPMTWVREMREEKIRLAERLMSGAAGQEGESKSFYELRGDGWTLKTDLKEPEDLLAVRDGLRFAVRAFTALFPDASLPSGRMPLTVIFFQHRETMQRLQAFDTLLNDPMRVAGKYTSLDRMIVALRGEQPRHLISKLMVHEAAHHFVTQSIGSRGRRFPAWLNEGLAAFIECLRPAEGDVIELERLDRGKALQGGVERLRPADHYIAAVVQATDEGRLPPLAEFLSKGYEREFYGSDATLSYGMAWALVHYLINAEEGKYREAFRRWVSESPVRSAASLERAVGRSVADLEQGLTAHVQKLSEPSDTAPSSE
jgi:hypothetical protein